MLQLKLLYGIVAEEAVDLDDQLPMISAERNTPEPVRYEQELYNIQNLYNKLLLLYNLHKFFKLDKETAEKMLIAYDRGDTSMKIIMSTVHTVTEYETIETIAQKYNLDWQDIAEFNDVSPLDIEPGDELEIPYETDPREMRQAFLDNPVFDIPEGVKVLGRDLPNELVADSSGDLQVLTYRETLEQGLKNTITTEQGDLPLYPDFGFNSTLKQDFPEDLRFEMLKVNLANALERDTRVLRVPRETIEINRTGDQLRITVQVVPINNITYFELIEEI